MNSMTGFGTSSFNSKDYSLEVSIKSVNSRFLDSKFYSPHFYHSLDPALKDRLKKSSKRGFFTVHLERSPSKPFSEVSLKWHKKESLKWKRLYNTFAKQMKLKTDLHVQDLIDKKGVIEIVEREKRISVEEKRKVMQTFDKALKLCLRERQREGLALKKDILLQISSLGQILKQVESLNKKQMSIQMKKKNKNIKDNKKAQAMESDKFDTHEEIIRVKEHLSHFKDMMKSQGAIGRKLDFYIQEILREMNTISSKSLMSKLTSLVVEGKFLLEKIKEQIQNIE